MGRSDHIDYDENLGSLPPDAFGQFEGPIDPDNQWLRAAARSDQIVAMRAWFMARHCDPASVLLKRFSGIVDDETIQEVIDEINTRLGGLRATV